MRAAAERIRLRLRRSAEDIVAIGEDLLAVKAALPHGAFGPWLAAEFEMTTSSASRFMQVAERFSGKFPKLGNLPTSALYELAAPSTPDSVVAAVETRAAAGEAVTLAEVKRLKAALQAAGAEVKPGGCASGGRTGAIGDERRP